MPVFRLSFAVVLASYLVFAGSLSTARAKADFKSALALAIHNTNTVRTLVHHDKGSVTSPSFTSSFTIAGEEDEVHNREQDTETVTVRIRPPTGKPRTLHYVADVIFLSGKVYYRINPGSPTWKSQKGKKFADPYTGGFQRARTSIDLPKHARVSNLGTSGGLTHARTATTSKAGKVTLDVWFTSGKKPYVVREVQTTVAKANNLSYTLKYDLALGSFNGSVVILPPTSTGT